MHVTDNNKGQEFFCIQPTVEWKRGEGRARGDRHDLATCPGTTSQAPAEGYFKNSSDGLASQALRIRAESLPSRP